MARIAREIQAESGGEFSLRVRAEQLHALGISGGCGGGNFCPNDSVTRGQMAVFLTTTFSLVLYGP